MFGFMHAGLFGLLDQYFDAFPCCILPIGPWIGRVGDENRHVPVQFVFAKSPIPGFTDNIILLVVVMATGLDFSTSTASSDYSFPSHNESSDHCKNYALGHGYPNNVSR